MPAPRPSPPEETEMSYLSEANSAETVNGRIGEATDKRLRRVMTSLVDHLHDFIKDVELTEAEWEAA
ncbi:MAG: dioxygenase, partial [Gemmobacter sp.]